MQRGKSRMGGLLTKARFECAICGSVLAPATNGYEYQRISAQYPGMNHLRTGTRSVEELTQLADRRVKQSVEEEQSGRSLAAREDNKRRLQPLTLSQFFGQPRIKEDLAVAIGAAKARGEPLGHVLLCGPEGCGKRTLALVIGNETDAQRRFGGSAKDLIGFLFAGSRSGELHPGDIVLIDHNHRLPPPVEECLCPIMQDFVLNEVVFTHFTLIGATDQPNRVSPQLRRCFQHIYEFEPYDDVALGQLLQRRAEVLGIDIEDEACWELGRGAKGTIREAERLLDRARDYGELIAQKDYPLEALVDRIRQDSAYTSDLRHELWVITMHAPRPRARGKTREEHLSSFLDAIDSYLFARYGLTDVTRVDMELYEPGCLGGILGVGPKQFRMGSPKVNEGDAEIFVYSDLRYPHEYPANPSRQLAVRYIRYARYLMTVYPSAESDERARDQARQFFDTIASIIQERHHDVARAYHQLRGSLLA